MASQRNVRENKDLQKVDIAEALTKAGVPNGAHPHTVIQEVVLLALNM